MVLASAPLFLALRRLAVLCSAFPIHPGPFRRIYSGEPDAHRKRIAVLPQLLGDDRLGPLARAFGVPDVERRIAEVDEALADLESVLPHQRASRPAFLRVFAFGGLLVCLVALLEGASPVSVLSLVVVVVAGGVGFLRVDRAIEAISEELREGVDGWVDAGIALAIDDGVGRRTAAPSNGKARAGRRTS